MNSAPSTPPAAAIKPKIFAHPLAWIVLAVSLAASGGGWFIARQHEALSAQKRFEEEAGSIRMLLSERMAVYQDVLHGGLGLFAASYSVERAEWKAYVDTVSVNERFPGIDGVGFIACVPRTQLESFLATTRADRTPAFQLKNSGTNEELFVTKYLEPEAEHADLIGRDIGADPGRRALAEKARDTGEAVISGRLDLLDAGARKQAGLIMMLPVFRNGTTNDTPAQRRANIAGWVYARFVMSQLMGDILRGKDSLVRFQVFDHAGPDLNILIYDSDPPAGGQAEAAPRYSTMALIGIGQRHWLLQSSSRPEFNRSISRGPEGLVAAGGGLISLLLFGIALSLSATRDRALVLADRMTKTLRETNSQLEQEIKDRQRMERRAAIQHAVTRVLADADTLADATPKVIEAVCQSMGWDVGAVWRIDGGNKRLRCEEFWHRPGISIDEFEAVTRHKTYKPGEGLPGRIWATNQPVWIADLTRDPNSPRGPVAAKAGMHAAFGFPVMMSGDFLGVIEFFSHAILAPDAEVLRLVAALGSQIGQFIERKSAEEKLQHEKFLLDTLMQNLPDRIYFKDRQSRFLRNSKAHLQRFGLENPGDAIGKTDFDFFTDEHARQAYEDEQKLIQTGGHVTKEEKETWPDGSVSWALSTKMVLRNEAGEIVGTFGISRDITDRKRAEEAMRLARDAAEEANRTKSQFLANMSHELRTPLNSVIGFAGILLKNKAGNLGATDINFLERIQSNGKHLLVLINEILDLSKIEARRVELQIEPVALGPLVRETIAQQEGLVRDRPVQLLAEVPENVAPVKADADKLRQVIINLIGNALKFTERGSISVRVVADPATHQPLRIDVTDTGIGIPRDKLKVIFEAFQQADASTARKYGGTGLGLTISQALCHLMGFHIEVSSEVGKGSTFSVMLGAKSADPLPEIPVNNLKAVSVRPAAQAELGGKLVLVIDDESDSRVLLANLLEEFGCQVISANSGEQGLRMAREFRPQLITVDLLMPQMDGAAVIRALKSDPELRAIPLVVVSIVAEERRGTILGAVDILEKPVVREDLLATLQRNLQMPKPRILIVDDEEDARKLLVSYLDDLPSAVHTSANGREALAALEHFPADLALLDLVMPEMDGVAFLDALRKDPRFQQLPVIVVTSKDLTPAEKELLRRQSLEVLKKTELSEEKFKELFKRLFRQAEAARPGGPAGK